MTHSMNFTEKRESRLFRGIDPHLVRDLFDSKELNSPVLFLSRSEVTRNYDELHQALPRAELHYAVKSNNHQVIIDEVARRGGNFDVCSTGEIDRVLRTGVKPASVIHSLPIKPVREFDYAVEKGLEIFVVDNPEEVRKLERYQDKKLKIMIRFRINTNTTAVVNLQYKFGCLIREVIPLAKMIREYGHEYYGLSFHIGSQCVYSRNYIKAIAAAQRLIDRLDEIGLRTHILNIGGGFPVEYVEPTPEIDNFCAPIRRALDQRIRRDIKIVAEPGRFISASPVTLVCSVIGKARRDGKMWYYLDDGLYSTFSGILFDHCQYPVVTDRTGKEQLSVLAGPTCDSFDVMYDGLMIPDHEIGDLFVFPMTGAYCAVSGSDFNSLRRPAYQIID